MRALPQWLRTLGNTADGVFIVDEKQRIIFWNRGMESLLGHASGAVRGRFCFEVLCGKSKTGKPWCRQTCTIQRAVNQGTLVQNFDLLTRTTTGAPVCANVSVLSLPRGRSVWTVHIAHDVSRAERQEEALLLIQRTLRILNQVGNKNIKNLENGNSHDSPQLWKAERFRSLTRRELDVLQLLVAGFSTADIATKLCISQDTVRNHVRHLLAKTGTHNRTQLAIFALRNGYC